MKAKEITMHKGMLLCGVGLLAACIAPADDRTGDPASAATGTATAYSFDYFPMGFARITAAGAITIANSAPVAFDSMSSSTAPVTVSHTTGNYSVTFASLAAPSLTDATGGDVQVTAEGTTNVRCRVLSWGGSPNLTVNVQCTQPDGTLADSGFAVQFFRYAMPARNAFPTRAAYSWVQANGVVSPIYDYNASGDHNTVTKTTGRYTIQIPGAVVVNASMMVTSYGGSGAGAVCSVASWGAGLANIECRNAANQLVDSAFSFSYSTSGPSLEQQGAHAWFDGSAANTTYSAALGKIEGCSVVSVTGSHIGSQVKIVVSGDLGSWDATPFLRASFSSAYGAAGYCKVESLTATGVAPSSTATTLLRCYDPTGAVIAAPRLTFTHVTSDAAGPC
jgi:hypothetical protein